jgi:hypothetical protein
MANDSSSTTLGIQFKSSSVAAVCICLALKTLNFKTPSVEKWVAKWNDVRLSESDQRFQSVEIEITEHQGSFLWLCHCPGAYLPIIHYFCRNLKSVTRFLR